MESTLEILAGGTWNVIDADFARENCSTASGSWEVGDGVIIVQNLTENGQPVSEPVEEVPYTIVGNTLTFVHVEDDLEVYERFDGPMPTCGDYAFPRYEMFATIDGVEYDFSDVPFFAEGELAAQLASGAVFFGGWAETPEKANLVLCVTCKVLELEFQDWGGPPIAPGTYTVPLLTGPTAQTARATYREAYPSTEVSYGSEVGDGVDPPWSGAITVTSASPTDFAGTFEFVLHNGGVAPLPAVTVTNGSFRVWYD